MTPTLLQAADALAKAIEPFAEVGSELPAGHAETWFEIDRGGLRGRNLYAASRALTAYAAARAGGGETDAVKAMQAKRAQLETYRASIEGDGEVAIHARAVADGRIQQIDQDMCIAATAQSGWMPIETAPKDGEWVLLFSPDSVEPQSFTGQWSDDDQNPWGGAWWPDHEVSWPIDSDPTHWMPLPAAPTDGDLHG